MQNQPRYFHESPTGCREAERKTWDLDQTFPEARESVVTDRRFAQEKEQLTTLE
jgi:hypothetical protein